jgi:hypothetical protein
MALVRWLLIAVTAVAGLSLWAGGQCSDDDAAISAAHQATAPQTTQRHPGVTGAALARPHTAVFDTHVAAHGTDCCPVVALTTAKAVRADAPQFAPAQGAAPHPPAPASVNRHSVLPARTVTLTQIGVSRT